MVLVTTASWMEFVGTSGNGTLPATEVNFLVPISTPATDNPPATSVGYTINGATTSVVPIVLASGIGSVLRTLTITEGTWLLTAHVNTQAVNQTINLTALTLGFVATAGNAIVTKTNITVGLLAGNYYGECLTKIYQVAGNTVISLDATATFTTAGGSLEVSELNGTFVGMTATRLS